MLGAERAHEKNAALDADAHQKCDASVHVQVFEVETQQTQPAAKRPIFSHVVVDSKGQRHHVGQVSDGQVDHEDDGLRLLAVNRTEPVALDRAQETRLRGADAPHTL